MPADLRSKEQIAASLEAKAEAARAAAEALKGNSTSPYLIPLIVTGAAAILAFVTLRKK